MKSKILLIFIIVDLIMPLFLPIYLSNAQTPHQYVPPRIGYPGEIAFSCSTDNLNGSGLDIQGIYAYMAAKELGLIIYNIENKSNPLEMSMTSFGADFYDIVVRWNIAYCAAGTNGLYIIDVTLKHFPNVLNVLYPAGNITKLALHGNYLFAACEDDGFRSYNITNPEDPIELDVYACTGCKDIILNGMVAYIITSDQGVQIIDISNPADLKKINSINLGSQPNSFALDGFLLYIGCINNYTHVVDVADPLNPSIYGNVQIPFLPISMAISGDQLFVGTPGRAIYVVDITTNYFMGVVDTPHTGENEIWTPNDLIIKNDLMFIADGGKGFRIVRISTMVTPRLVNSFTKGTSAIYDIEIEGNMGYVTSERGMGSFDVGNPSGPIDRGYHEPVIQSFDAKVVGSTAYLLHSNGFFKTINASNRNDLVYLNGVNLASTSYKIAVEGYTAYCAGGTGGMSVIDISNPILPVIISSYIPSTDILTDIVVQDGIAYLAYGDRGLELVNVTDPTNPQPLNTYPTIFPLVSLDVFGEIAVIPCLDGLHIMNVADPYAITELSYMPILGWKNETQIFGDYLFVCCEDGFKVINIENLVEPSIEYEIYTSNAPYSLDLNGGYIYMANKTDQIYIFRTQTWGNMDYDGDDLGFYFEVWYLGTDPCNNDTDNDGIADNLDIYPLDPTNSGTYKEKNPFSEYFLYLALGVTALVFLFTIIRGIKGNRKKKFIKSKKYSKEPKFLK